MIRTGQNKIATRQNRNQSNKNGFTILELIIATFISLIVIGGVALLATRTVKNGKFVEKLADTNVVTLQKSNQLFNNSIKELAKIPKGQTRVGSIDPTLPVSGYFDLLNESGCVVKGGAKFHTLEPLDPISPKDPNTKSITNPNTDNTNKTNKLGKLGDIGSDSDSDFASVDCSISASSSPSLTPKFRRQWVVVKDFPNSNDVTFSVVVVAISTNQIVNSGVTTKTDGVSIK